MNLAMNAEIPHRHRLLKAMICLVGNTMTATPNKIELKEGEAYVRYEGVTYKVSLSYFMLEATPDSKYIEVRGIVRDKWVVQNSWHSASLSIYLYYELGQ